MKLLKLGLQLLEIIENSVNYEKLTTGIAIS